MEDNVPATADIPTSDDLVALFDDLVRVETRLYNAVNDELRAAHGIATSQFEFLRHLRDRPDARVGDLAAAFAIGVGATSKGINRLEARGWVARVRDPADQRSSVLHLTDVGTALVDAADETFRRVLRAHLGEVLGAAAVPAVGAALHRVRSTLEQGRVGTPTG